MTEYVYRLRLYFGSETDVLPDPDWLQSTRIILSRTQPLEGHGYHVITDRFYTSPELAMALENRSLAFTVTVQVNQRGMPQAVKSAVRTRLERGTLRTYRDGNMMVLRWQDKRTRTVVQSLEHTPRKWST